MKLFIDGEGEEYRVTLSLRRDNHGGIRLVASNGLFSQDLLIVSPSVNDELQVWLEPLNPKIAENIKIRTERSSGKPVVWVNKRDDG